MAYKLLGIAVWKGAMWFIRRRATSAAPSKPVLAGGLLVAALGALLFAQRRSSAA